jgi:hypothetical protein
MLTMTKQEPPTELTLWLTEAIDRWRKVDPDVKVSEILESLEDIRYTLTESLTRHTPR